MTTLRRKILGDLRAQGGAFLAVWLTAVLGLTFYGSTYPAGIALIDSVMGTYTMLHYADFNARFDPAPQGEVIEAIAGIEGVTAVEGRLAVDAGLELQAPDRITLHLISLPDEGRPVVNDVLVVQGDSITEPGQLLVLESFATFHGIQPGDTVRVWINDAPADLTVAGLVFTAEYLIAGQSPVMPFPQPSSFGVAYLPYRDLAALLDLEGQVNDLALTLAADADEAAIRAELESALAPYNIEFIYSRLQTASGGVVNANVNGDMAISTFLSAMFLIISGLVMAVLLARLMDAEKRRIGTMRALGLSRAEALRHYLAFPLIIGLSGAVVGSILGYLASFFVAHFFIITLFGGSLPAFVNTPQWAFIAFGAAVTFALALLAGAWPTWRASGTDPGLALRPVTPKGMGAHARITIPGLPLAARQALRNMLRVPARTVNTFLGVLLGFTVIIATSGLADVTNRLFEVQFIDGLRFDLQVNWATLDLAETREALIAALPGVGEVEMILAGPVTASYEGRSLDTLAVSVDHETDFYAFETVHGAPALSSGEEVWIGHNLARVIGVEAGDTLTLSALGQTHEARVAGVLNQAVGSLVWVPAALMNQWVPLGLQVSNVALVRAEPGAIDAARRALIELEGVVSVSVIAQSNADLGNYMSLFSNFSYLFQAFGYALTLLVLFNTVSINLHERREELAIMRAVGASLGEIARAITWETLSVTVVAMILGLPLGWWALGWLMQNYNTDFFGTLNYIAPRSYAFAIVGIVAVVLLAEWLGLRDVRRADLGHLSKSLSA